MDDEAIVEELGKVLEEENYRQKKLGEYHPSQISSCPLSTLLDWMTDSETTLNHWLFSGTAVHYYLQESGLLSSALHNAGYHYLDTKYEVSGKKHIGDGVYIVGTCDVITYNGDNTIILDKKYSSVTPSSGRDRIYSYLSQVNTYSYMFGADEHGLLIINNRADDIPNEISLITGEPSKDNWELVKEKAKSIDNALYNFGYPEGNRWNPEELDSTDRIWGDVLDYIDKKQCPSYERECNYCDHSEYCPVKQGNVSGLQGMGK